MKVKVDKLTSKEFSEYTDSSFAKIVKMTIGIFLGIIMIVIALSLGFHAPENVMKPLWIAAFILVFLIISSNSAVSMAFKKSGFAETKCTYSFDGAGMDITIGDMSGDLGWEYVKYVKETENLFIIRAEGSQFIIPKRCLSEKDFLALIEDALPNEKIKKMKYKKKDKETESNGNKDN